MPRTPLLLVLILVIGASSVFAQEKPAETTARTEPAAEEIQPVTIVLVRGDSLLVDEVSESADGYWYKRGNVTTFLDRARGSNRTSKASC